MLRATAPPYASKVHLIREAPAAAARPWIDWALGGAIMLIAALFRVYLLRTTMAHLDGDQAVIGLMAYHVQAGERPVFYYGQPYQGSLEAYLAAIVFHVFGASEWTLHWPALAFSILFVGAVYALATTLYGRLVAVLSGVFLAFAPNILANFSTAPGYGYIEVMLCGTLLLLLVVRYPDLRDMPLLAAAGVGLLSGLGLWMQPMMVDYLLPVAIVLTIRLVSRRSLAFPTGGESGAGGGQGEWSLSAWLGLGRSLAAIAVALGLGAAPLIRYNLRHSWATFAYLQTHAPGGDHLAVAGRLVSETLPVLLGVVTPTTSSAGFAHLVDTHLLLYVIGVAAGLIIVGRLVVDPSALPGRIAGIVRRPGPAVIDNRIITFSHWPRGKPDSWSRPAAGRDGVLALFAVTCPLLFVFSQYGAIPWATHLPRYLIPMYTATPLVVDCFLSFRPPLWQRWMAALAVGLLLLAGVPTTTAISLRGGIGGLTNRLAAHHVRAVYSEYWLVNRISFETHERIIAVAVNDDLQLGQNRIPGYPGRAARVRARQEAWIFYTGSPAESRFWWFLRRRRVHAQRWHWQDRVVYSNLSRPLHPPLRW